METQADQLVNDVRLRLGDGARTRDNAIQTVRDHLSVFAFTMDEVRRFGDEHVTFDEQFGACSRDSVAFVFGPDDNPMYLPPAPHSANELALQPPADIQLVTRLHERVGENMERCGVHPTNPSSATQFIHLMEQPHVLGALIAVNTHETEGHLVGVRPDLRLKVTEADGPRLHNGYFVLDTSIPAGGYRVDGDGLAELYGKSLYLGDSYRWVEVYMYGEGEEV